MLTNKGATFSISNQFERTSIKHRGGVEAVTNFRSGKASAAVEQIVSGCQKTNQDDMSKKNKKSADDTSDGLPKGGLTAAAIRAKRGNKPKASKKATEGENTDPDAETAYETNPRGKKPGRGVKPKAAKEPKEPKVKNETGGGPGQMPKIMGQSATSVIRLLGKNEVPTPHVKAILAAQGIHGMPPASLSVQLGFGRSGKRPPANLSSEQYDELLASAPAPEPESKAA